MSGDIGGFYNARRGGLPDSDRVDAALDAWAKDRAPMWAQGPQPGVPDDPEEIKARIEELRRDKPPDSGGWQVEPGGNETFHISTTAEAVNAAGGYVVEMPPGLGVSRQEELLAEGRKQARIHGVDPEHAPLYAQGWAEALRQSPSLYGELNQQCMALRAELIAVHKRAAELERLVDEQLSSAARGARRIAELERQRQAVLDRLDSLDSTGWVLSRDSAPYVSVTSCTSDQIRELLGAPTMNAIEEQK